MIKFMEVANQREEEELADRALDPLLTVDKGPSKKTSEYIERQNSNPKNPHISPRRHSHSGQKGIGRSTGDHHVNQVFVHQNRERAQKEFKRRDTPDTDLQLEEIPSLFDPSPEDGNWRKKLDFLNYGEQISSLYDEMPTEEELAAEEKRAKADMEQARKEKYFGQDRHRTYIK